MTQEEWFKKIVKSCEDVGTYQEPFNPVIETLAAILERRDETEQMYKASGSKALVKHVNKGGNANIEQNPALRLINDLNRDALEYWRDLGLTPAGLKKLKDLEIKSTSDMSGLERALNGIARELGQSS